MSIRWLAPAVLLTAVTAPAQGQVAIDLLVGPNWSSISAAPVGWDKSSDIGWFAGGQVRIGKMFYVAPGFYYQYQSFILNPTPGNEATEDNVPITSLMFPLGVGVNLNAKVVAIQLSAAGTVAFNTKVGDNSFDATKDFTTNNTRWGYMLSAGARILMLDLNLSWQNDLTQAFKGATTLSGVPSGDGKISQFRLGLGIGF